MDEILAKKVREITHQLNNHITAVLGYVELLLQDIPDSDPKNRDLNLIKEHTIQLSNLITELQEYV